jgi:hypothetical protein
VSDRSRSSGGIGTRSNDASAAPGHPKPSLQSVTYLVKPEWPEIALFYAVASLANEVRLSCRGCAVSAFRLTTTRTLIRSNGSAPASCYHEARRRRQRGNPDVADGLARVALLDQVIRPALAAGGRHL